MLDSLNGDEMAKLPSKAKLEKVNILIADADSRMAHVLTTMLKKCGFKDVNWVKDGSQALSALSDGDTDILITDWEMKSLDGIALVKNIRRSNESLNRTMPVIMLTARAEQQDVEQARDSGVNEFIVKPFNTQTVFKRIQQVIDNPRSFILSPNYVGPERRRREDSAEPRSERRRSKPKIVAPHEASLDQDYYSPKLIPARNIIKEKMNLAESISRIITPKVLEEAQEAIDAMKDESLVWLKEEIEKLKPGYDELAQAPSVAAVNKLMEVLLRIKAQAGTFGLTYLSDAAQLLYKFLRMDYTKGNPAHHEAIMIHVSAMTVLFAEAVKNAPVHSGPELIRQLKALGKKYQKKPG